jgi:hypothetical protein
MIKRLGLIRNPKIHLEYFNFNPYIDTKNKFNTSKKKESISSKWKNNLPEPSKILRHKKDMKDSKNIINTLQNYQNIFKKGIKYANNNKKLLGTNKKIPKLNQNLSSTKKLVKKHSCS